MTRVDLWDAPLPKTPEVKVEKELDKPKRGRPKKEIKKETKIDLSDLYVVTAGINKATERQLFLSTFDDCDDWIISVVPSIMNKSRALKMMEKAQQFINDNPKRYRYKPPILVLESVENPEIYEQVRCILK